MKILFITQYKSSTLNNLVNYIPVKTNVELDYMIFGLFTGENMNLKKNSLYVSSDGKKINKTFLYTSQLGSPFRDIYQFALNTYIFFILLKIIKRQQYNICIAETTTIGIFAWLLKKIGKCKITIYHNCDIYPTQSHNIIEYLLILTQKIFRWITYKNDIIWYVREKLKKWDEQHGYIPKKYIISNEFAFNYKKVLNNNKKPKKMNQICFIGSMNHYSGLDISIECIKYIKKVIPDITFKIIGGYRKEDCFYYQELAKQHGISDRIQFMGYIPDEEEVEDILSHSALGLAVYSLNINNGVLYTDPGKVKDYFKAGIPVVLTKSGPEIVKEIEKYNAGVLVNYNPRDIAKSIIYTLQHRNKYKNMLSGVLQLTYSMRYEKVLSRLYKDIIQIYHVFYQRKSINI